ncbi:aldo/keto reductase [Aurantimicrobium sp. MWH-Uga1]|uniref:aldo/keto reductase n=1 Tax=Aurantimicrobium sp. MWH-Uga1 TaxID=2079575 RepID=UPI000DEDFF5B|nr:aldo/keto reductase [Aurantimicrobium sp. MWH-Uga1]AXE54254.1 2,5-diketo-D-gluconic acid reductase B [Aurantimicrobium sp. MWH-Uga1]
MTIPTVTLNDGLVLPQIGLGTYKLTDDDGIASIVSAIHSGYRLIDTATRYNNEVEVGKAIAASGVPREEIIVTTKLPGAAHGFDETMASFELSRQALGLDFIDLYLIHWPNPSVNRYLDSWQAMIELKEDGLARSIGVCNFTEEFLTRIIDATGVVPSVNQIELHPYFPQAHMREVHAKLGIQTESWSPLGKTEELRNEKIITDLAEAHQITPAQLILRWHTQQGMIPLPKSGDPERQASNLNSFGFDLTVEEISLISSLERGRLWGGDPNTHEEM